MFLKLHSLLLQLLNISKDEKRFKRYIFSSQEGELEDVLDELLHHDSSQNAEDQVLGEIVMSRGM